MNAYCFNEIKIDLVFWTDPVAISCSGKFNTCVSAVTDVFCVSLLIFMSQLVSGSFAVCSEMARKIVHVYSLRLSAI
jgi:hypothetical protein